MPLPQRPGPYILTLLVIVLAVLVAWMFQAVNSPEIDRALEQKAKAQAAKPAVTTTPPARPAPVFLDPVLQAQADRLNAPEHTAHEDVQIVAEFVDVYRKALGGNPIGQNDDITAALTGTGGHQGRVFPPNSPAIRDGKLVDRWGTPYWFHPESSTKMEIRSAGPDKDLFTGDDVIHKP